MLLLRNRKNFYWLKDDKSLNSKKEIYVSVNGFDYNLASIAKHIADLENEPLNNIIFTELVGYKSRQNLLPPCCQLFRRYFSDNQSELITETVNYIHDDIMLAFYSLTDCKKYQPDEQQKLQQIFSSANNLKTIISQGDWPKAISNWLEKGLSNQAEDLKALLYQACLYRQVKTIEFLASQIKTWSKLDYSKLLNYLVDWPMPVYEARDYEIIDFLCLKGADINYVDDRGLSIFDVAVKRLYPKIYLKSLRKKGAKSNFE